MRSSVSGYSDASWENLFLFQDILGILATGLLYRVSSPPSPRSDHNSAAIWDALLQIQFWDLKADVFACRHIHEQLTHAVQQAVDQYQGSECLLLILDALQAEATKVVDEAQQHAVERSRGSQEET